ncbi:DUF4105 domain-containing protein [Leptospira fluminis]|uniref:DUF4105 domain-containing protein n=2 Tax=Leptospira fluminis TaxID=2484979 RepID=A0A4R9GUQ8_9LEPT|nr:DUF4105 domain-containing protein [Leptospira fluminis]
MTKVKFLGFFPLLFLILFFFWINLSADSETSPSGPTPDSGSEATEKEEENATSQMPSPEEELKRNYFYGTFDPETAEQKNYLNELLQGMENERLYLDPHWFRMQRYKKGFFGGVESEADSLLYFLSPDGKSDPKAEMKATLHAFFGPESDRIELMHPQCIYPERYFWLKEKLHFDQKLLKEIECTRFATWRDSLDPKSVTVVFSSYYMQSPASVLGHTLFKVDSAKNADSELLDYGVNYAANTDDHNPFTYTIRGLTGGYPGTFAIFPYYLKVNEYNDMESRDLWEYKLALSKEERDRFLRHLWEMGRNYFDYFFFTQNCSFHMLGLLDVARPDLNLTQKANWIVSPPDTVKLYLSVPGLVVERKYRPSLYSKIKQKLILMTAEEQELYWSLLDAPEVRDFSGLPDLDIRSSLVLDALLDSYRYRKSRDKSSDAEQMKYKKYLLLRSKTQDQVQIDESMQVTTPPEESHSLSRVAVGFGASNLGGFTELKYRIAYHDFLNTDKGHVPNSEVQFLNLTVRKYEGSTAEFTSMNILRLMSLSPYNPISKQFSYGVDLGTDTVMVEKEKFQKNLDSNRLGAVFPSDPVIQSANLNLVQQGDREGRQFIRKQAGNLEVLYGYSFQDEFSGKKAPFLVSFLGGLKAQPGAFFEGGVRYGPEAVLNVLKELGAWKFQLYGSYQYFRGSGNEDNYSGNLRIRYLFNKENELRLELNSMRHYDEVLLSYNLLF